MKSGDTVTTVAGLDIGTNTVSMVTMAEEGVSQLVSVQVAEQAIDEAAG